MPFLLTIPGLEIGNPPLSITIDIGEQLFVLGANGAGKSALMHKFYVTHPDSSRRITAHRQTWFDSNSVTLSAHDKRQTQSNVRGWDQQKLARWKDDYSSARTKMAVYDLIDAENTRAREITKAVDESNFDLAAMLSKRDAPIQVINELLKLSNIPIEISVHQNDQVVARKLGVGNPYSIAELSDGERNALLVAAQILTISSGALILVDEPERHLHRAIISPLLTLLFGK